MILLPAIDLLQNRAVRLTQGDYNTAKKVAADPLETALSFQKDGAKELHLVDLDGAKAGRPCHTALFQTITRALEIPCEVGGGIRTEADLEATLEAGAKRVILGSAALRDKEFVRRALLKHGSKIAIGIDARDGKVCADGWLRVSETDYLDFAKEMQSLGAQYLIFTDISRDGTLQGPNLSMLENLCAALSCNIIASGGVKELSDILALSALPLYGAICGKSLYAGTLSLREAIRAIEQGEASSC